MPIDFSQFGVHGVIYTIGGLIIAWLLNDRRSLIKALRIERSKTDKSNDEYLEFAKTASPVLSSVANLLQRVEELLRTVKDLLEDMKARAQR